MSLTLVPVLAYFILKQQDGHRELRLMRFLAPRHAQALDWAFAHLGWSQVIHTIHPDNLASIRLAERLGSTHRGPARLPPPHADMPVHIWAQHLPQWQAGAAARQAALPD